jgi:hypothetical protein
VQADKRRFSDTTFVLRNAHPVAGRRRRRHGYSPALASSAACSRMYFQIGQRHVDNHVADPAPRHTRVDERLPKGKSHRYAAPRHGDQPADTWQGHGPRPADPPSARCGTDPSTSRPSVLPASRMEPVCSLNMVMEGGKPQLRLPASGCTDLRLPKADLLFVGLDVLAHPI